MTLAAFADLAEVIGALGVIAGLVFVGVQLRQNTKQMQRGEMNSAMAQGSGIRHSIIGNRDFAEVFTAAVSGSRPLDVADEARMSMFFSEATYLAMQEWDRAKHGLAPKDEFARSSLPFLAILLSTPRGAAWWANWKRVYRDDFVAAVEDAIPALKPSPPIPSAIAPQGAETAVAPPADAR